MFCQTKHDSLWCSSFLLGIWNSNSQLAWRTLFGISYTLSLLRHISTIFLYLKNSLLAFTLDRFMAWIKNSRFIAVASHPLLLPPPLLYFSPVLCPLWSEVKSLRHVRLFVIPWTLCDPLDCIAHQAPLSLGFSRQEYWSGLPFPSPGDLPDPGIEPRSPTLQADALTSEPLGKPLCSFLQKLNIDSYFPVCNVSFVSLLWNFSLCICFSAVWLCVPGSGCLCPKSCSEFSELLQFTCLCLSPKFGDFQLYFSALFSLFIF